ncbi:MAG TPA: O-methyltransferase [Chitinophagaceae bacterium]|nr:O-methyltransferase [Chitinophagaceae bacterium]
MELVDPRAMAYAEHYSTPPDALLEEVADFTRHHQAGAHMLSGAWQGKFLEMISLLQQPRRILELGTFTGYSALCLAKGLAPDGLLHTIELREADARQARAFFDRSPWGKQIILHTGPALEVLPGLQETWDLVFLDADKTGYVEYFDLVWPRLRKHGMILADNVLFHGQVLEPVVRGKSARGIQAFNEMIRRRTDLDKVLLPVRDGLFLIRKP